MLDKEYKVQLRGGFADRNQIHPENISIQYEGLDYRSRVALVNELNALYHITFNGPYMEQKKAVFWGRILEDVYLQEVDFAHHAQYRDDRMFEIINTSIYEEDYSNVLSVVEYIAKLLQEENDHKYDGVRVYSDINQVFEKEFVGYRFVNGIIVKITNDVEIKEIEEAIAISNNKTSNHLGKAMTLLSNREKPDYENSIKESISAVEAMCNDIVGKKATLGDALKQLQKYVDIHPRLVTAFDKLYAYTCDASGVRHSGEIGGSKSTFEEAKFMLVACSGFVNYLKGIQSKDHS